MRQPARLLFLLLAIPALCLTPTLQASASAQGSCLYQCQGPICNDFSNTSDMCMKVRATCQARCSGRRWWGAIAYSASDKAFGWSVDWNDVKEARKDAMKKCAATGKTCKLWVEFENECGAVAADGALAGWGTAGNRNVASQRARTECGKAGGKHCAVQVWACSTMW